MIVTKLRVTKLDAPVIVVVIWSLGDRAKDRRYRPGRATLWVATDELRFGGECLLKVDAG